MKIKGLHFTNRACYSYRKIRIDGQLKMCLWKYRRQIVSSSNVHVERSRAMIEGNIEYVTRMDESCWYYFLNNWFALKFFAVLFYYRNIIPLNSQNVSQKVSSNKLPPKCYPFLLALSANSQVPSNSRSQILGLGVRKLNQIYLRWICRFEWVLYTIQCARVGIFTIRDGNRANELCRWFQFFGRLRQKFHGKCSSENMSDRQTYFLLFTHLGHTLYVF